MDFFKIICDGQLVDPKSDTYETEGMHKKEPLVEKIGDVPIDQPHQ